MRTADHLTEKLKVLKEAESRLLKFLEEELRATSNPSEPDVKRSELIARQQQRLHEYQVDVRRTRQQRDEEAKVRWVFHVLFFKHKQLIPNHARRIFC